MIVWAFFMSLGYIPTDSSKMIGDFPKVLTSTGSFSKSIGSSVTSGRFSPSYFQFWYAYPTFIILRYVALETSTSTDNFDLRWIGSGTLSSGQQL